MKLYAGIDLHSTNSYVLLLDETEKVVYEKRLNNDLALIKEVLKPYQEEIVGAVVESTYNWYWLVDGLKEAGYKVHLANTTANKQYGGLKHTDDKSDAKWLAQLLRLGLLEEGYIYPKEERGLRELVRRRINMVQQQTSCLLGIQAIFCRYENKRIGGAQLKGNIEKQATWIESVQDKNVQALLTIEFNVLNSLVKEITGLEKNILTQLKVSEDFKLLKTAPGIGSILGMTILLETGNIARFEQASNYASYCRAVESKRISNGKKKGENNRKNGSIYLGWSFMEAANGAIRHYEPIKKYYQRKLNKAHRVVALKTVANKLARACYFILRDKVEFDMNKAFG